MFPIVATITDHIRPLTIFHTMIHDHGGWPKQVESLNQNKSIYCGLLCWYCLYYIVHCHIHNSLPLISTYSHTNPNNISLFYLLRPILLLYFHLPIGILSFRFSTKVPLSIYLLSHACRIPSPFNPPLFDHTTTW